MGEWRCIEVGHHDQIGTVVGDWERAGWKLHTYNTVHVSGALDSPVITHFLLFVRGV
jgi:hypothetical protein